MKEISINDLKAQLSMTVAEAEAGADIVITRHSTQVARLGPASPGFLHRGTRVGRGAIEPALDRGTNGRYLEVLMDDRGDR